MDKKLILLFALAIIFFYLHNKKPKEGFSGFLSFFSDYHGDNHNNDNVNNINIQEDNYQLDDNYEDIFIKSDKKKIILYYAKWCHHCKILKPIWIDFIKNHKNDYKIISINCSNKSPNPKITGFPTIHLEKDDKFIECNDNINNKEDIIKFINKNS